MMRHPHDTHKTGALGRPAILFTWALSAVLSGLLAVGAAAQCTTPSFTGPTNFAAGNGPNSVTTGDFNGDGRLDLAVANELSDNVSILLSNGPGTFTAPTNFAAGDGPFSVTTGDFNGDGRLDLAVANINSDNVSILLNSCPLAAPAAPTIAKSFTPPTINAGAVSQLTLTFSNPAGNVALTNLAVTDNLPAGVTVAATPGLVNTCGGMVTGATAGSSSFSLSGGALPAGPSSCQVQVNVTSSTPGTVTNTTSAPTATGNGVNVTGTPASATLTVNPLQPPTLPPTVMKAFSPSSIASGGTSTLTITLGNPNPSLALTGASVTDNLPAGLTTVGGTAATTCGGTAAQTATAVSLSNGTIPANGSCTLSVQVTGTTGGTFTNTIPAGALTTSNGGTNPAPASALLTVNPLQPPTSPLGPGAAFPAASEVSDQKAGSVLVYNLYSSSAAAPNTENTRLSITNTNSTLDIAVHLFFVDGATCSIADAIICLTKNQTASFLASDLDPGTTGYIVAVASDPTTGCPVNFNFLIGDAYVKLATGHAANLGAEAFSALGGSLTFCNQFSVTAQLNFDGVSYNRAPRTLAASSIPARADGNNTLLVVNRFGGNLAIGAATLLDIFGIFYDDAENALSFTFRPGTCQFRSSLSNTFPRLTPRFETFIPAGRSGWLRLYSTSDIGLLGAVLNLNPNAQTNAEAFNQGRNLHKLTLTSTQTLVIPIFPPNCLD